MTPSSPSPDLNRLRQELRESRASVTREYSGLLSDLDLQKRFTESVKRHPLGWIGGAAAATATVGGGLTKAGWIGVALELGKLLYPILRPVVVEFVGKASRSGLAKRGRLQ